MIIPRGMRSTSIGGDMSVQLNKYMSSAKCGIGMGWKMSRCRVSAVRSSKPGPRPRSTEMTACYSKGTASEVQASTALRATNSVCVLEKGMPELGSGG